RECVLTRAHHAGSYQRALEPLVSAGSTMDLSSEDLGGRYARPIAVIVDEHLGHQSRLCRLAKARRALNPWRRPVEHAADLATLCSACVFRSVVQRVACDRGNALLGPDGQLSLQAVNVEPERDAEQRH